MTDWLDAMVRLRAGALAPVSILVGTEHLLMRRFIETARAALDAADQQAQVRRYWFDEDGGDALLAACRTVSLFDVPTIYVLENCTALLPTARGRADNDAAERWQAYFEQPDSNRVVVITVHAQKLDDRKKITRAARLHPVVECGPQKPAAALTIVKGEARQLGLDMSGAALTELLTRSASVSQAVNELVKLAAFSDTGVVTADDVQELVAGAPDDDVFQWLDHVVRGQAQHALLGLHDVMANGTDPFALMALLARQMRMIRSLRQVGRNGASTALAARLGVHPFALRKASEQATGWRHGGEEDVLLALADAEFAVKSGRREVSQALEWVILACAGAREGIARWAE